MQDNVLFYGFYYGGHILKTNFEYMLKLIKHIWNSPSWKSWNYWSSGQYTYIYIYIYIIHNTYIIHIHIYTLFIYIYTNYVYIYNFIRRSRHSGPEILWYFNLSKLAEREVSCKLLISVKREILIGPWLLMPERSGVMTYLNVTYHNGSQGRPACLPPPPSFLTIDVFYY